MEPLCSHQQLVIENDVRRTAARLAQPLPTLAKAVCRAREQLAHAQLGAQMSVVEKEIQCVCIAPFAKERRVEVRV
jgi:hypothetical protein